jgi:DNA polymerase-3 subunit epsilon
MAREIVFDTETTGLNPLGGDRIVEIGCVEIDNSISTGKVFHAYMNPERDMPEGAFRVHGLSTEFLADKPLFSAIAEDLLNFIGDSRLIAHNASFDMGFLNAELTRSGHVAIGQERVVDTLVIARRKHPYASNSLDALCQRYNIDTSRRIKHGALLDAELLAEVYSELLGGRQTTLGLVENGQAEDSIIAPDQSYGKAHKRPVELPARLSTAEQKSHEAFIAELGTDSVWRKYIRAAGGDS